MSRNTLDDFLRGRRLEEASLGEVLYFLVQEGFSEKQLGHLAGYPDASAICRAINQAWDPPEGRVRRLALALRREHGHALLDAWRHGDDVVLMDLPKDGDGSTEDEDRMITRHHGCAIEKVDQARPLCAEQDYLRVVEGGLRAIRELREIRRMAA